MDTTAMSVELATVLAGRGFIAGVDTDTARKKVKSLSDAVRLQFGLYIHDGSMAVLNMYLASPDNQQAKSDVVERLAWYLSNFPEWASRIDGLLEEVRRSVGGSPQEAFVDLGSSQLDDGYGADLGSPDTGVDEGVSGHESVSAQSDLDKMGTKVEQLLELAESRSSTELPTRRQIAQTRPSTSLVPQTPEVLGKKVLIFQQRLISEFSERQLLIKKVDAPKLTSTTVYSTFEFSIRHLSDLRCMCLIFVATTDLVATRALAQSLTKSSADLAGRRSFVGLIPVKVSKVDKDLGAMWVDVVGYARKAMIQRAAEIFE